MIRVVLSIALSALLPCTVAAQSDMDSAGLSQASESLPQINRFELTESGRLRLKRDHWVEEEDDDDAAANAIRRRANRPFERLLNRLLAATSTHARSASYSTRRARMSFEGSTIRGTYEMRAENLRLAIRETVGRARSIRLVDSDETSRFLLLGPESAVQILRSPSGVHVCSVIDGEVESLAGDSFIEVVKSKPGYFQNVLAPHLKNIAMLPIEAALEAETPKFKPTATEADQPSKSILTTPRIANALRPLVQLRLVNRQLQFNRVLGDKKVIESQVKETQAEMQALIDAAMARLKAKGATPMQLGDFQRQVSFGGPASQKPQDMPLTRKLFHNFQRLASGSTGNSGSWGGDGSFDLRFNTEDVNGRVTEHKTRKHVQAADSSGELQISCNESTSSLRLETPTGVIAIVQSQKPETCSLLVMSPTMAKQFSGVTYVGMLQKVPTELWQEVKEEFSRYGVGGLDPFTDEIVADLSRRLAEGVPARVDITTAKTAIESVVLPLLNDASYLQAVQDRLPEEQRKNLRKRIIQLRRASRK